MVSLYGMTDKFGMAGLESVTNRYLDGRSVHNCSEETLHEIDHEIIEILRSCKAQAMQILTENKAALEKISEFLIEKETITGEEFMKILTEVNTDSKENIITE